MANFIAWKGSCGQRSFSMKALLVILLPLLVVPLVQAEMREWKTADESKTLVAEYVSSRAGKVTIRRKLDRRLFTLSLDKLSEQDREYVKQREEEGPGDGSGEAKAAEPEQLADSLEMHRKRLRQGRAASSKDVEMLEGQGFSALADEEKGLGVNDLHME